MQYFAVVEPQKRAAPHAHFAIRGTLPRAVVKELTAATYAQVWWPAIDVPVYTDTHYPDWDDTANDGDGGYVDPDTRQPLLTWDEALDDLSPDVDPDAEPRHVARFGEQVDVKGVLAGSPEAERCIGYLVKYLVKDLGDDLNLHTSSDDEHAPGCDGVKWPHQDGRTWPHLSGVGRGATAVFGPTLRAASKTSRGILAVRLRASTTRTTSGTRCRVEPLRAQGLLGGADVEVMDVEDRVLAQRLVEGDEAAFAAVFDRYARLAYRVARRWTGHREDAQDVVSSAFCQVWQLRGDAHVIEGSLRPWVLAITVNMARNSVRDRGRRAGGLLRLRMLPCQGQIPGPEDAVLGALAAVGDAAVVTAGIARLPAAAREIAELCLLEGLSPAEAAVVLGIHEGTARSRLSRARSSLRGLLQSGEPIERWPGSGHLPGDRPARAGDQSTGVRR